MRSLAAPLLRSRRPIIMLGQSNMSGGYRPIGDWPSRLQFPQDPIESGFWSCHLSGNVDVPVWRRIQSFVGTTSVAGVRYGHWGIDLADGLLCAGISPALLYYAVGGADLALWVPGAVGSWYASFVLPTIKARLAELDSPQQPIVVMYQGESGYSAGTWQSGFAAIMAGLRADLGYPTMGAVVVQLPLPWAIANGLTGITDSQAAYVASDARSKLAYSNDSVFVTDPAPAGLHIDTATGRRLAIGPNSVNVVSSVLSCIKGLI